MAIPQGGSINRFQKRPCNLADQFCVFWLWFNFLNSSAVLHGWPKPVYHSTDNGSYDDQLFDSWTSTLGRLDCAANNERKNAMTMTLKTIQEQ